jgi:hypothetical protein
MPGGQLAMHFAHHAPADVRVQLQGTRWQLAMKTINTNRPQIIKEKEIDKI